MLPSWPAALSPTHTPASASQAAAAAAGEISAAPDSLELIVRLCGVLLLTIRRPLQLMPPREMPDFTPAGPQQRSDGPDFAPAIMKEATHRGAADVEMRNAAPNL